jgi:hypothetical protein
MQDIKSLKQEAIKYFAEHEVGADEQTRMSLLLLAIKNVNALVLSKVEVLPIDWMPYSLMHGQLYKEMELIGLLQRLTKWSTNPLLYVEGAKLGFKLWNNAGISKYLITTTTTDNKFFEYLALSHCFMTEVRFFPLLPMNIPLTEKYIALLRTIETANEKQMQVQIRFLKGVPQASPAELIGGAQGKQLDAHIQAAREKDLPLSMEEREAIVEEKRAIVIDLLYECLSNIIGKKK